MSRRKSPPHRRRSRLEVLAARCLLAGDAAPSIAPIDDQIVEVGAPMHVAVDGFDEDGGELTVEIEVADPTVVEASLITGNRSLRLDVSHFGSMIFELFEGRAPRPAGRVADLAASGFYDGVEFHRVVDQFVIQAGIPVAGTPGANNFDDQFHPDLQHNRPGVLSFAKTTQDDSNHSQFFVTAAPTRSLDFNHSVFGQLVEGDDVREAISNVDVGPSERPLTPVIIESATVFDDIENSVVMLRALGSGGQTEVTITIRDPDGNSSSQTFLASTIGDQVNAGPYLSEIPDTVLAAANSPASLTLTSIDIEDDAVTYFGQYASNNFGSSATLNPQTGLLEITPADGFTGTISLLVGTRALTGSHVDTQVFRFSFVDSLDRPGGLDLLSESDLGTSNADNLTSADTFSIEVTGTTAGVTVELFDEVRQIVLASAQATTDSTLIDVSLAPGFRDGALQIVARQRLGTLRGDSTDPLEIQIDRTAPVLDRTTLVDRVFAGETLDLELISNEPASHWTLFQAPENATLDATTGVLRWTPASDRRSDETLTVRWQDAAGNPKEESFPLYVRSRYLNPIDRFDVDASGSVTSRDALLVINALSRTGGGVDLPDSLESPLRQDYFYNANDDLTISALDALVIINELGRRPSSPANQGESEFFWPASDEDELLVVRSKLQLDFDALSQIF